MNIEIRIPGRIYEIARADLDRAHPFAAERIGFFSTSVGRIDAGRQLVLFTRYHAIPDGEYIDDPFAGARIDSRAIRSSLQRILDEESGQFHVHVHGHQGLPGPSPMDSLETPRLIESMVAVNSGCAHGAIILSRNRAWAQIWAPGAHAPLIATKITVVGFPLRFLA